MSEIYIPDYVCQEVCELINIMKSLQVKEDYSIMLAGGAVRDSILGKEIKDFDLFITSSSMFWVGKEFKETLTINGYSKGGKDEYEGQGFEVWTKEELRKPVQLIFNQYNTEMKVLSEFDFAICQVAHLFYINGKSKGYLRKTSAYNKSYRERKHYLTMNRYSEKYMKRVKKILDKYPWPVEITLEPEKPTSIPF